VKPGVSSRLRIFPHAAPSSREIAAVRGNRSSVCFGPTGALFQTSSRSPVEGMRFRLPGDVGESSGRGSAFVQVSPWSEE